MHHRLHGFPQNILSKKCCDNLRSLRRRFCTPFYPACMPPLASVPPCPTQRAQASQGQRMHPEGETEP